MKFLFRKYNLFGLIEAQPEAIRKEVEALGEDYILGASEEDLVQAFVAKFTWEPPALGTPVIASDDEVQVERQYSDYGARQSVRVNETRIVIHIPFTGDAEFFDIEPNQSNFNPPRAVVKTGYLEVVIQGRNLSGVQVKETLEKETQNITFHLNQLHRAAEQHNSGLTEKIRPVIQARKRRILDRRQVVASTGIPMRKRDGVPATYAVPNIRRKPPAQMPVVKEQAFTPEPILPNAEYENILSIIRSMVRVMENSPHQFADLGEEAIRSHFLVQLNGQYQGRATGETFNYEGKTDILIREGNRNIFIAECKFWKGKESLTKTINQVLGYLHWRDTKAAILLFNRNRDFSNVLAQITPTAEAHPCFKRMTRRVNETEWRFIFCNKDDQNRELELALLAFDIPQPLGAAPSA